MTIVSRHFKIKYVVYEFWEVYFIVINSFINITSIYYILLPS